MNSSESVVRQRQKEGKALKIFLVSSLLGSLALHAVAMTFKVGNFWSYLPTAPEEEEMELVVEAAPPEEPVPEEVTAEVEPPPDVPEEVTYATEVAPPPPLAPESPIPLEKGEDAPSDKPATSPEAAQPMTNNAGDTGLKVGGGPIFKPFGLGSGFGNANRPTGFNPLGKPDGDPNGKPGGVPGGKPDATATRTAPPAKPKKPVCVSCPQPKYRGTEAVPVVDIDTQPDGSVKVRLRKSSGDPATDRETLETISKWRFDPQTIPEGGTRLRRRVTYEERGSEFQRQNEERRRREADRRQEAERRAEQEQQRRAEEERKRTPATATDTPEKPAPSTPSTTPISPTSPAPEQPAAPPPEPAPAPALEAAPPPVAAPAPAEPPTLSRTRSGSRRGTASRTCGGSAPSLFGELKVKKEEGRGQERGFRDLALFSINLEKPGF
ncbi:energy transducer TonB [Kovacikia minuta CCNUW1]|uniref:energy transducer TonB family protein n=1 Tax=Kovacikia minuta TaxID=2931930 RepID=UPI001CC9034D|nr:energy transducer TonB [Kovacikia minuta]UBF26356.1 energy transducer TonB [Kovacikia minuta CCNUW1]